MAAACAARSASRPLGSRAIPMPVPASPAAATPARPASAGWSIPDRCCAGPAGGAPAVYRSSDYSSRAFCPHCGSSLGAIDDAPTVALLIGAFDEHRDPALRPDGHSFEDGRPSWWPDVVDRRTESGRVRFPYVSAKHLVLFSQRRKRLVPGGSIASREPSQELVKRHPCPLTSTSSIVMDKVDRTVSFSIFSRPMAAHFPAASATTGRTRASACSAHAHESCPEDQQIHRAGLGQLDFGVQLAYPRRARGTTGGRRRLRSSISRLTFKAPATAPSCNGAGDLGAAHQDLIDAGDQFLEII